MNTDKPPAPAWCRGFSLLLVSFVPVGDLFQGLPQLVKSKHIPQQFHDPLAGFVRLLAVPLKWGLNDLVYLWLRIRSPALKPGDTPSRHTSALARV